jgi:hypothetical protein
MGKALVRSAITVVLGMLIGTAATHHWHRRFGNAEMEHVDAEVVATLRTGFMIDTALDAVLWRVERGKAQRLASVTARRPHKLIFAGDHNQPIELDVSYLLITEKFRDSSRRYTLKMQAEALLPSSNEIRSRQRFPSMTIRGSYRYPPRPQSPDFVQDKHVLIYALGNTELAATPESSVSDFEQMSRATHAVFILLTLQKRDRYPLPPASGMPNKEPERIR